MSNYIIPTIVLFILFYGCIKKVNCYKSFTIGAKKSFDLILDIFPFIIAIMIMVSLLRASGINLIFAKILTPIFNLFSIPSELCEIVLLKPFSGSGSIALLSDIYKTYGVDSYIARCASVIIGSSETTFYISAIYFSKTKVKRLGYAIPVSLFATFIGVVFSCFICKFI